MHSDRQRKKCIAPQLHPVVVHAEYQTWNPRTMHFSFDQVIHYLYNDNSEFSMVSLSHLKQITNMYNTFKKGVFTLLVVIRKSFPFTVPGIGLLFFCMQPYTWSPYFPGSIQKPIAFFANYKFVLWSGCSLHNTPEVGTTIVLSIDKKNMTGNASEHLA